MIEWFRELPLVYQIGSVILALMLIGVVGLLANRRGNVVETGDLPVAEPETDTEEDFSEDEEKPEEGMQYKLTDTPYPAEILVEDVDGSDITGELIIDLPSGALFVSLQRVYSDDYEEFILDYFVVVYRHNGLIRTQTWSGDLKWGDYSVYPSEITIRDDSLSPD